jgi:DNA-binding NarL/FixJ family response regulator
LFATSSGGLHISFPPTAMKRPRKHLIFVIESKGNYSFLLQSKFRKSPEYQIMDFKTVDESIHHLYLKPDLIILDDYWPSLNVMNIVARLKLFIHKTPLLFLTSFTNSSYLMSLSHSGVEDYLIKEEDSNTMADRLINRIVNVINKLETKKKDIMETLILFAIAGLMLSVIVIYLLVY